MYKLIIEDDEGKTTVVPLIRDEISIGRKEGNTIRLTERNVSRHHARLYRQNGTVYVEDLNSHNGTKINGERLQKRTAIGEGDSIQIGDYRLSVKLDRTDAKGPQPGDEPLTKPFVRPSEPTSMPPAPAPQASAPSSAATMSMPQSVATVPVVAVAAPAPAPERPARLVVISSNFAGQEFPLEKAAVVIGRTDENDVVINHRSISRHHAKIVREGTHYHIVDLQSANGVRVNAEEYGKVELRKGDQIDLGHVRLVFVPSGQDFDIKGKIVDIEGSGKGRPWLTWAIVALIVVGGVGAAAKFLVPQSGSTTKAEPDTEAAKLLLEADTDLHGKRWVDALDKVERALQIPSISQQTKEAAALKRDRAQAEKKTQGIYERFIGAAGSKNYDEALQTYKELPADSVYHSMAQDAYNNVFPLFIELHLRKAEEARGRGACPERDQEVQKVLDLTPGNLQAQSAKDRPCPEKLVAEVGPPPKGRRNQPKVEKTEPTVKVDTPPPAVPEPKGGGMNEEEANERLSQAQTAYVNGEYSKAIELARPALKIQSSRAWRIIGAAACYTRDLKLIGDAYKRLEDQGRQYVVYVCQRQGVERAGNSFKFAE